MTMIYDRKLGAGECGPSFGSCAIHAPDGYGSGACESRGQHWHDVGGIRYLVCEEHHKVLIGTDWLRARHVGERSDLHFLPFDH